MNIEDFKEVEPLSILLKGESGCGKSIQAASFPNVYFFDFDKRFRAVVDFYRKNYPERKDIAGDYYQVTDLEKAFRKVEGWITNGCPYNTLVFDTTTTLIDSTLFYIDRNKVMMGASKGKDAVGMQMNIGFIKTAALDDYKYLLSFMKQMFDMSKRLKDVHIIYNAHLMVQEKVAMDGTRTTMRMILAPGKTSQEIPIHFNEVFHLEAEASPIPGKPAKRILYTDAGGFDFARTTLGLPVKMDVSTKLLYDQLVELVPGLKEVEEKRKKK